MASAAEALGVVPKSTRRRGRRLPLVGGVTASITSRCHVRLHIGVSIEVLLHVLSAPSAPASVTARRPAPGPRSGPPAGCTSSVSPRALCTASHRLDAQATSIPGASNAYHARLLMASRNAAELRHRHQGRSRGWRTPRPPTRRWPLGHPGQAVPVVHVHGSVATPGAGSATPSRRGRAPGQIDHEEPFARRVAASRMGSGRVTPADRSSRWKWPAGAVVVVVPADPLRVGQRRGDPLPARSRRPRCPPPARPSAPAGRRTAARWPDRRRAHVAARPPLLGVHGAAVVHGHAGGGGGRGSRDRPGCAAPRCAGRRAAILIGARLDHDLAAGRLRPKMSDRCSSRISTSAGTAPRCLRQPRGQPFGRVHGSSSSTSRKRHVVRHRSRQRAPSCLDLPPYGARTAVAREK